MIRKKMLIATLSISLSVLIGSSLALVYNNKQDNSLKQGSHSVNSINKSLEEAFWNVQVIIKGTVLNEGKTYQKDAGVQSKQNFSFDVTPANIKVDKVLYGKMDTDIITYLQHGSSSNSLENNNHVKKGEEVILMLVKTDAGDYWSYNFDDGIWNIKDGKVSSRTESKYMQKFKGANLDIFMNEISSAAKNKKRNENYKQ